jgi:hypothetical protein
VLDTECHDRDGEKDPALFNNPVHSDSRSFEKQMISDSCHDPVLKK